MRAAQTHHDQNEVLLRYPAGSCWLRFRRPLCVLSAHRVEDVVVIMREIDRAVQQAGLYAAGFVAYEAAPAFDPVLKVNPAGPLPLAWFGLYERAEALPEALREALPHPPDFQPLPGLQDLSAWSPSITRPEYDTAIARVKDCIACGETYQVNYTYRLHARFEGDPWAAFLELYRAQNAPYAAFIRAGQFALCSASPELFFTLDGELLASKPMKGTAARGRSLQEDLEMADWLRSSEKNRAENLMIVDMVRNDIGKIARTGSVRVPELFSVEKYPTVWQMVSTVTGETSASLSDIFAALFPPASITGAPKRRTMEIIADLETTPRQVYTGCIGFAGPGRRAQFNVAIRTLLVDTDSRRAEYGTGGGITWDSTDKAEWEECQAKARILFTRFPSFSLLESILWTPEEGFFLLEQHLERLAASAAYFSFPVDLQAVREDLAGLVASLAAGAVKVRLLVDERGRIAAQAVPLPESEPGLPLQVCLAPAPVDSSDVFLYHKTTHRKVYERAWKACEERGGGPWEDVILWNEKGELTEACSANLVVEIGGERFTPPVSCGLLPGVYRNWLLAQGKLKERIIRVEDLFPPPGSLDAGSPAERPHLTLINSVRKERQARVHLPGAGGIIS